MPSDMTQRTPQKPRKAQAAKAFLRSPVFKIGLCAFLFLLIGVSSVFLYYYAHYSVMIDRKLSGEIFKNTAKVYALPYHIYPGQKIASDAVITRLQRAGFEPAGTSKTDVDGVYEIAPNRVTIKPAIGDVLRLDFQKNSLTGIVKPGIGEVDEAWLPAEVVTNLF